VFCATGIDEQNEYAFLFGLSNGYVAVKDEDNPDALLRINFQYQDKNKFGIQDAAEGLTVDDLKFMKDKADEHGDTIIEFWIAKSAYDKLRKTKSAKILVAQFNGQVYHNVNDLPVPTAGRFNDAFLDETGATFRIIDRSITKEKNGQRTNVKPWNANMVIGVCNTMIGALVYGRLAEQTNPVPGVQYTTIDTYKLIAKFSKTDPLLEATTGQAYVLPVIENADQVYQMDVTKVQEVDEDAESQDTTDQYITVWGNKYLKSAFITELNKFGAGLRSNASDAQVIKAVNKLNDEETAKLKAAVQGAIVS
jgi:hypothetical protein